MAISFSRPDPSSAASVSSAQFPTSRRGFDQAEVRDFLRMVAAELARLQERERFLERELRSAQHPGSPDSVTMDDDTATRLLGEEAARVLQTAREAATQIRARAEDGSARLLREATDEAQRLREEAEIESARRRQDAASDAEAEVQMAKQQGRDMVNEARAYRERVLSELARRRELARQQLEQLIHGRDRLLQAFERSRLAAVDVMAELTPLGEPVEYVNLQPTTGPVPLMVPATSMYMQPDRDDDDLDQVAQTQVEVAEADIEIVEGDIEIVEADVFGDADDDTIGLQLVEPHDDTVVSLPEPAPFDDRNDNNDREPARVVSLFAKTSDRAETKPTSSVDDLFARLRESRADTVVERTVRVEEPAAEVEDEDEESQTESGVDTVAEAVVPLILSASRKLKRVLADEQNELLDLLRRKEPVRTLDDLLPWEADQSARYSAAVEKDLVAAAVAGAQGGSDGRNPAIVRPAIDAVTNDIISPLRDRLTRSIDKAAGVNSDLANEVRGIYREWKAHRIDEYVEEIVRLAYDRGALTVTPG
jgi:DivIVA domain-containing protein